MKIPFSKIELPKKILDECRKILASGNLTNSTYVEKFEKEVAKVAQTKYAVATNSCTTGLMLVCREVFYWEYDCERIGLPDYTWQSTKSAITGLIPMLQGTYLLTTPKQTGLDKPGLKVVKTGLTQNWK